MVYNKLLARPSEAETQNGSDFFLEQEQFENSHHSSVLAFMNE